MNNELRDRIQKNYYHLSNANKLIADTILSYEENEFNLKIVELANTSYCSNAAITKFIKIFGYNSYKVFQHDLNKWNSHSSESILKSFQLVDTYFNDQRSKVEKLLKDVSGANKLYLFATGQSQVSAIDFSLKYNKLFNNKCIFEPSIETQRILLTTVTENDLVILISNSGESRELLNFMDNINLNIDNFYLVTNRNNSSLAKTLNNQVVLNNIYEPEFTFREYPKESKYSLLYFFDLFFEKLLDNKNQY